jgi:uncharacterized membrane protein YkvA (DUF1232 family)
MNNKQPASPSAVFQFIRTIYLAIRLLFSPKVPLWPKIIPVAAVLYLVFPFDFIPDFIPGLGQLDDLTIILIALWAFVQLCPRDVIQHMQDTGNAPDNRSSRADAKIVDGSYRVMDQDSPGAPPSPEPISPPPDHSRS